MILKLRIDGIKTFYRMNIFQKLFSNEKEDLGEIINSGAFLLDVRSNAEFKSGHVKGSVNIPLDRIQSEIEQLKGKSKIVVFCQSGMRSAQAKSLLKNNGFENVVNGGSWTKVNALKK